MGRTVHPDSMSDQLSKAERSAKASGRGPRSSQPRSVLISKALSRLLRHQAENEGVPISADGWVRLDCVLAWKGLNSRNGVTGGPVTIEEVWSVVEENEKKRFAVRLAKDGWRETPDATAEGVGVEGDELKTQPETTVGALIEGKSTVAQGTRVDTMLSGDESRAVIEKAEQLGLGNEPHDRAAETKSQENTDSETARAISYFRNSTRTPPASEFLIRATQGHSIKTVATDAALLRPISLADPSTVPTTCVHGTFYGSWRAILATGGLKRMGRNHVHFAEGPSLAELGLNEKGEKIGETGAGRKEVISGMRKDAQLLIYVDVRQALEEEKKMEWWRSENGVILTEGVEREAEADAMMQHDIPGEDVSASGSRSAAANAHDGGAPSVTRVAPGMAEAKGISKGPSEWEIRKQKRGKQAQAAAQSDRMVPMKFWSVVIDVKGGRQVLWRQGEGVIQELPDSLLAKETPKGRGRGGGRARGRGRGG